jgi:hypothetical protein
MFNRITRLQLPAAAFNIPMIILAVTLSACATQPSATLKINPRHVEGVQYGPQELTRMMTDLGYQRLRVEDPVTQQSVAIAEKQGEYRLLFQSQEDNNIRVDAHIVKIDGRMALYFYNINKSTLSSSSLQLFEKLQHRMQLEYGADNVSSHQPVSAP